MNCMLSMFTTPDIFVHSVQAHSVPTISLFPFLWRVIATGLEVKWLKVETCGCVLFLLVKVDFEELLGSVQEGFPE